MEHEYAEILQALIDMKTIQSLTQDGSYVDLKEREVLYALAYDDYRDDRSKLRVKPSTILIAGMEVPAPRDTHPELGATYYCLIVGGADNGVSYYKWHGGKVDHRNFASGQCWDTEADAAIAAKAIAKLLTGG